MYAILLVFATCALAATSSSSAGSAGPNQTSFNGSVFQWKLQDVYGGPTFFDKFNFFTDLDPTHGLVDYVDNKTALAKKLAYVQSDGKVIMKADNTTVLSAGQNRSSVRIESIQTYDGGLFLLDVNAVPWGCGIWPAFWTLGGGKWPYTGEIDVLEGRGDNLYNQVSWHTGPGCVITPSPTNYTGTTTLISCESNTSGKPGCDIVDDGQPSYGAAFNARKGGVYAMKWDVDSISIWFFARAYIPSDIAALQPDPASWGKPVAILASQGCDLFANFNDHRIIFDITFCGDGQPNAYAAVGCSDAQCTENIKNPRNFDNATWSINSVRVYQQTFISVTKVQPSSAFTSAPIWAYIGFGIVGVLAMA